MYRLRARKRNENDKVSTGYPRDEYRGHVILPPYFDSRPSTPQSLGYGSNISEPTTSGYNLSRSVISDTTNSPTKKSYQQLNSSSSEHTRKVAIEQGSSRKSDNTKENRATTNQEYGQHHRASQSESRPDVFRRLGPTLTPNLNAKRFKADTSSNSERSHGWEGMGEKERSGYQPKYDQGYQAEHQARNNPNRPTIYKNQRQRETDKGHQTASHQLKQTNKSSNSNGSSKQIFLSTITNCTQVKLEQ